jgi:UDP-N-acetylmuramoyl-L-alanyl-D-glutamate--2,6-diaminopimelate ligase
LKLLAALLRTIRFETVQGSIERPVRSIVADSRAARPGDVFVCLPGYCTEGGEVRADRHDYVSSAVERGAAALVIERDIAVPPDVTVVRVADCWTALAAMAAAFFDEPAKELVTIGVTGTSGKTSTTYFIGSVLSAAGLPCARIGTIEYALGDTVLPALQTTPEAHELHRLLRMSLDRGLRAAVMEVSSHALELRRVARIGFDVAVFTNISQDHLNFHPDMHHYLRAKGRLFQELGSGGKEASAVVNVDDPCSEQIIAVNRGRLLTYGVERQANVAALRIESGLWGTRFLAKTPIGDIPVQIAHVGDYHVHNALATIGTAVALGIEPEAVRSGLADAPPVPGRFETLDCGQDYTVAVDYAHKPEALRRLLRASRALGARRIITVFGCGGDRDRAKRPLMGRIAAELSDLVVVTSDNPRGEEPQAIIKEIVAGARAVPGAEERLRIEPDRENAIAAAVRAARTGDLVLIAGKGHEGYQLFADRRVDFDDRDKARQAIVGSLTATRT